MTSICIPIQPIGSERKFGTYFYDKRDKICHEIGTGAIGELEDSVTNGPLRREIKEWFDSTYDYAKHHINPMSRASVSIHRSFRKTRKDRKRPEVRKLSMRLDSELVKLQNGFLRITVVSHEYELIPDNGPPIWSPSKAWCILHESK